MPIAQVMQAKASRFQLSNLSFSLFCAAITRLKHMEHRRRSSIINDDVENLMNKQAPGNGAQIARNYRPTMVGGKMANQIQASLGNAGAVGNNGGGGATKKRKLHFGNDVEVYTRPMTTHKDKGALHYNRQELFQVQPTSPLCRFTFLTSTPLPHPCHRCSRRRTTKMKHSPSVALRLKATKLFTESNLMMIQATRQ
jgi:hypothetical protein